VPGPALVVVFGPGGVGKGTVVARLLQLRPEFVLSRSWTTRPPRAGERADAYVFVDRATFLERVDADGFLEWTEFPGTGHLYGTPTLDDHGSPVSEDGTDAVILEIDLDGARQVKQRHPESVLILIAVASPEIQEARLRARGDDEEGIARRLAVGAEEMRIGLTLADYVVENDEVERCALEVAGIIDARLG